MRSFISSVLIALYAITFVFASPSLIEKRGTSIKHMYGKHRLVTYVVDWEIPKSINWKQLDHIAYAFAEPDSKGTLKSFTKGNLKNLVKEAHKHKVGVSISVGGWSGSKYFSSLVKYSSSRKTLVQNIVKLVDEYKLDGVNLDWEYPNDPDGVSCNKKNPKDTENYLKFIKELRSALNKKFGSSYKLITTAVGTSVFKNEKQNPTTKLNKDWAKYVDFYYLMAYDISGSWDKKTGPNAPLKANSNYDASVVQGISAWTKAGIPKSKMVVGVPFYGTALKTRQAISSTKPYVLLASHSVVKGDKYDEKSADACPGAVASYSGSYQWRSIVSDGINSGKKGWKVYWDKHASTPYAYHKADKKYLSFDNAKSLKDKVNYVVKEKLGGVMVWSLEMDDHSNSLLKSLQGVRK